MIGTSVLKPRTGLTPRTTESYAPQAEMREVLCTRYKFLPSGPDRGRVARGAGPGLHDTRRKDR